MSLLPGKCCHSLEHAVGFSQSHEFFIQTTDGTIASVWLALDTNISWWGPIKLIDILYSPLTSSWMTLASRVIFTWELQQKWITLLQIKQLSPRNASKRASFRLSPFSCKNNSSQFMLKRPLAFIGSARLVKQIKCRHIHPLTKAREY